MKDILKRAFGKEEATTKEAPVLDAQLSALQEQLESANAVLAEQANALSELKANYEDAVSKLASYEAIAKEAEAKAEAAKEEAKASALKAKKEKLASVVGSENTDLDAMFDAVAPLSDEAFNVVVAGFAASMSAKAEHPMCKEVGHSADLEVEEAPINLAKLIKNK